MATSEVEICNSALIKLGAERINSLDDDTKEARLCKLQYPLLRDEVIRSHPWNFALSRVDLAKTANTPAFQFTNEFAIPQDVLRVLTTDFSILTTTDEIPWKVEHNAIDGTKVLVTDEETVAIQYIRKITDVQLFDANFSEALALRLASDLAYPLVQSISLAQAMFGLYQQMLKNARSFDGQEGSLEQVQADDFFFSRF